jgi:hypothetical protein
MNEQVIDELVQRLDRLERQNRWMKRIGGFLFVGLSGLVMMGQSQCNLDNMRTAQPSKIVEAQEFIVRDPEGRPRAKLAESGLSYTDSDGKERVYLGLSTASSVEDASGKVVIPGNTAELILRNSHDSNKVILVSQPDLEGLSEVYLLGADESFAYLGSGMMNLKEQRGLPATLSLSDPKTFINLTSSSLWFVEPRADIPKPGYRLRMVLNAGDNGSNLTLYDKQSGRIRAVLGATSKTETVEERSESSLVLFDKDQKVIWRAP